MSRGPVQLPRELVLASAGTGKTFRISSRILGLLALGAPAESIFASSFTRKAAGEILDRVLGRLAEACLEEGAAAKLSGEVSMPGEVPVERTAAEWLAVLERLARELHRLNIGTIDSFFVRAAGSFAAEIGLPPAWSIADPATMARLRAEALERVIAEADPGVVVELVRGVSRSEAGRSVHDALVREAESVLRLHHALDPDQAEPWHRLDAAVDAEPVDDEEARAALARRLRSLPLPTTSKGEADRRWGRSVETAAGQIERGEWSELVGTSLCAAARADAGEFYGQRVPAEICAVVEEAMVRARRSLGRAYAQQARALGRLAHRLDAAMARARIERGAYDFEDVTRLLGGPDPVAGREDLYYRLDARTQHILLDEFQDTSIAQWEALQPLVDELLAGYEGERAAVIVADPKQSIYAWRGGEPALPAYVGRRYDLAGDRLDLSWRSSQVVLDAVNLAFRDLPGNPVFTDDPLGAEVAGAWAASFAEHRAAHTDLPGHVRLLVGPDDEGRGSDRPNLCRRAAELVAELRRDAPNISIGVLTRRNDTVARIMLGLRDLDVPASGEGGTPLTDSAAAASVLALLRTVEHPGDLVARYHVARTPVGEAIGYADHESAGAAIRVARDYRRRLLEDGYGPTLDRLAKQVADACSGRERRRLSQLTELGYRFDARATLRIADFLRLVETERVQDATAAEVRVMTIHQAKGLEFDAVILPELDATLARADPDLLAYRPDPAGRARYAFPYVPSAVRELFPDVPELSAAADQARAGSLRDGLSGLYVALTRARHALHIIVRPDGKSGMGSALSGARLLRYAFGADAPAVEGAVMFESGDPAWHRTMRTRRKDPAEPAVATAQPTGPTPLRKAPRTRSFARRNPSDLAGGSKVDLALALNLEAEAASEGTLVHAWLEATDWIEDGLPADDELRRIARRLQADVSDVRVTELIGKLKGAVAAPNIRAALSRESYAAGATVEREAPFVYRDQDALVEGVVDRLVLVREGAEVRSAVVIDFKTDAATADRAILDAKVAYYAPQMNAYRRGIAAGFHIPESAVSCRLLFLDSGEVREVG